MISFHFGNYLDFFNWISLISFNWWFLENNFSISVLSFFSLFVLFFSIKTNISNLETSFIRAVPYFQFQWRGLELNRYRDVWGQYPENWRIYFHLYSSQEFSNHPYILLQRLNQFNRRNILWSPPSFHKLSNLLTYQIQTRISGKYFVRHMLIVRFRLRLYLSLNPLMVSMFSSSK
jgi:hypothetical protein